MGIVIARAEAVRELPKPELESQEVKVSIFNWEIEVRWPRKPPQQVFVRFGMWEPHNNQSLNFATGQAERGLSVYPAILDDDFTVRIQDDVDVCELVEGRLAFVVTGRVVGTGSDGEPLLRGVRCLPYPLDVNTVKRIPASTIEWAQGVRFPAIPTVR